MYEVIKGELSNLSTNENHLMKKMPQVREYIKYFYNKVFNRRNCIRVYQNYFLKDISYCVTCCGH